MNGRIAGAVARIAVAAAVLVASLLGGVAAAGPARAAATCRVQLGVSTWTVDANDRPNYDTGEPSVGTGFHVGISLTNAGELLDPWTATVFTPAGTRELSGGFYNAEATRRIETSTRTAWMVKALSYNSTLPTDATVNFGFFGVAPDPSLTRSQIVTTISVRSWPCVLEMY